MSTKKILVPYDASGYSNRAFKTALEIAKKAGSQITILTCIEGEYSAVMGYSKINPQTIRRQKSAAMKYIYKLESMAREADVPVSVKIKQTTSIVNEIVNVAKSQKSDLIVLGSHGRTGIKKLILGSVANGVAQHADCSVMVVK